MYVYNAFFFKTKHFGYKTEWFESICYSMFISRRDHNRNLDREQLTAIGGLAGLKCIVGECPDYILFIQVLYTSGVI